MTRIATLSLCVLAMIFSSGAKAATYQASASLNMTLKSVNFKPLLNGATCSVLATAVECASLAESIFAVTGRAGYNGVSFIHNVASPSKVDLEDGSGYNTIVDLISTPLIVQDAKGGLATNLEAKVAGSAGAEPGFARGAIIGASQFLSNGSGFFLFPFHYTWNKNGAQDTVIYDSWWQLVSGLDVSYDISYALSVSATANKPGESARARAKVEVFAGQNELLDKELKVKANRTRDPLSNNTQVVIPIAPFPSLEINEANNLSGLIYADGEAIAAVPLPNSMGLLIMAISGIALAARLKTNAGDRCA